MTKFGLRNAFTGTGESTLFSSLFSSVLKTGQALKAPGSMLNGHKTTGLPLIRHAELNRARERAILACKLEFNPTTCDRGPDAQADILARQAFSITGVSAAYDACIAKNGDIDEASVALAGYFSPGPPPYGATPESRQFGIDRFFTECEEFQGI